MCTLNSHAKTHAKKKKTMVARKCAECYNFNSATETRLGKKSAKYFQCRFTYAIVNGCLGVGPV